MCSRLELGVPAVCLSQHPRASNSFLCARTSERTSGASYPPRLSDSEITFPVMCSACVDVFHAGSARALAVVFPRSQGPLPRKDYVVFRGQRDPMAHDSL